MNQIMKSKLIIILFFLGLSGCEFFHTTEQQNVLLFKQEKVSDVLKQELLFHSDTNYFNGSPSRFICPNTTDCNNLSSFLRAVRKKEGELPLITKYYFGKDSILKFIHYEWSQTVPGLTVDEREQKMVIESKRFDVYVAKLNTIANILQNEMGSPISNDGEIKKNETSLLDIYKYQISFLKDKKHVDLKLVWSPKRGARFFKVWAKVYWVD